MTETFERFIEIVLFGIVSLMGINILLFYKLGYLIQNFYDFIKDTVKNSEDTTNKTYSLNFPNGHADENVSEDSKGQKSDKESEAISGKYLIVEEFIKFILDRDIKKGG
jgi:hypothetical protein